MKAGGELRSIKTEEGQFGNRGHTRVQCRQRSIQPSVETKSFGAVFVAPQAASDTGGLVRCDRRCPIHLVSPKCRLCGTANSFTEYFNTVPLNWLF